jgi:hypothetical protein
MAIINSAALWFQNDEMIMLFLGKARQEIRIKYLYKNQPDRKDYETKNKEEKN